MKQVIVLFSSLFLTLFLSAQDGGATSFGDSGASQSSQGSSSGRSGVGMVVGENYVLKPSDVLSVEVYQEQDLDKDVRVEGDGTVALSLIGKVKVAGMSVAEAQSLITDLYNRDYLVDPQVSVIVLSFSAKVVRILGSVNSPGVVEIPPDRSLTLTEAIAGANGVSRLGNPKSITIKRVDSSGRARQMEVNFSRILTDPNVKDVILSEGDTIWVPERVF
ncbi:MAG TPA: sugar transporter [Opitutae bacterium]|nr:sugar transporter [Opitutae bacterium]